MKRILSLALSLILIVACIPAVIAEDAAEVFTEGMYTYTVTDENAIITGVDKSIEGDVTIPDTLGGYPVTEIGDEAFTECYDLTGITIPDSVTKIHFYAFSYCENLYRVSIGNGVKEIDTGSFASCRSLNDLTLGDNVETIEQHAFAFCSSLTSVTIPDNVTGIAFNAFSYCYSLSEINISEKNQAYKMEGRALLTKDGSLFIKYLPNILDNYYTYTIPDGVISVAQEAFDGCSNLIGISIPASVEEIYESFSSCSNLESITVHKDNPAFSTINGILFTKDGTEIIMCPRGYTGSYTIPDGVKIIRDSAFYDCKITSVIIPDGVTSIGGDSFAHCYALNSINLPDSVTSIGTSAFDFCGYWQNKDHCDEDGVLYIGNHLVDIRVYPEEGTDWVYTVKDGTLTIADSVFRGSPITEITIPGSVVTIGNSAFYGAENLEKVTFVEGNLKDIGYFAFRDCEKLNDIAYPDSVTNVGNFSLGDSGYYNDPSNWEDGVLYAGNHLIEAKREITGEYTVKPGTRTIAQYAFNGCDYSSIIIPDSVVTIGYMGVSACDNLTSITIPEGTVTIDGCAFYHCDNLTSVTIPKSVTTIGEDILYKSPQAVISCYTDSTAHKYAVENEIPFVLLEETITSTPGDATGDGNVNLTDVSNILKHIASWEIEMNTDAADVTGDGKVNLADASLILKYIAGWDVVLK